MEMKCTGQPPVARSFHTVTSTGSHVLIMGGRDVNNDHLDDLHIFNPGKKKIVKLILLLRD